MEQTRVALRNLHAAGVGRHDHQVSAVDLGQVIDQNRHGGEMIHWPVEETLNLPGVQVDRNQTVGARTLEHVCNQTSCDRLAPRSLAVLAGVAVEGRHHGDAFRRRTLGGIDQDEMLHQRIVDRTTLPAGVGLHDEDIGATDRLAISHVDLAVGELVDVGVAQRNSELMADVGGKLGGSPPGHNVELLVIEQLHSCPVELDFRWPGRTRTCNIRSQSPTF